MAFDDGAGDGAVEEEVALPPAGPCKDGIFSTDCDLRFFAPPATRGAKNAGVDGRGAPDKKGADCEVRAQENELEPRPGASYFEIVEKFG